MFRKIVSLLFQEEEIVLEEDLDIEGEESIDIPEMKPISVLNKEEKDKELMKKSQVVEEVQASEKASFKTEINEDKEKPRSNRIDVDGEEKAKEVYEMPKMKKKPVIVEKDYKPQEIISPIFGGNNEEPQVKKTKAKTVKKNKPSTTVISPMYGMIEDLEEEEFDENILTYDLKDMLTPSEESEEVQVSLYDFLEDLDDEQ
ncbi:hypothetical protein ERUR111494_05600 [Erysipelothrix urinaevulpis]|uniref:hypothetical protein n=1 Tax=Erysipelothrix urinaevulpis TaxID=2683717 RepID=UPI00135BDA5C|nr:hypothetical protein [Erysipelothrix urinaevulpis]